MNKAGSLLFVIIAAGAFLPAPCLAEGQTTLTGTVLRFAGSGIAISNSSAAVYGAELGHAVLLRKNGAPMALNEILVGDKVQVTGFLWGDNSISVSVLRDLSLYAHNSGFTGKVVSINQAASNFTIQSKAHGTQTITTNSLTSFTKNGHIAMFSDLEVGMTATVKGAWDRSYNNVVASQVQAIARLINIDLTGQLVALSGSTISLLGNGNVTYFIDTSKATLLDKSGKPLAFEKFSLGCNLRVWGKHLSGSVQVLASKIKNNSVALP